MLHYQYDSYTSTEQKQRVYHCLHNPQFNLVLEQDGHEKYSLCQLTSNLYGHRTMYVLFKLCCHINTSYVLAPVITRPMHLAINCTF